MTPLSICFGTPNARKDVRDLINKDLPDLETIIYKRASTVLHIEFKHTHTHLLSLGFEEITYIKTSKNDRICTRAQIARPYLHAMH